MTNPDCHYGDHDFQGNGWCKWCNHFNGGWLAWQRYEKAEREGRVHDDHFHMTLAARIRCNRKPNPEPTEQ